MRFTLFVVTLTAALAGCEKNLLANLPDAAPDATTGCPTPGQPLAAGTVKVYLNTEGVTLSRGGVDARTNTTDLVVADNTVVPPFLAGDPDRQAFIDEIVTKAQAVLAPYSIDIVTARPASGDYGMFVLGGDNQLIAGSGCGPTCSGVGTYRGCGKQLSNPNQVSIYFDFGRGDDGLLDFFYANKLLNEIGFWADLVPTTQKDDCLCRFDAACEGTPGVVCTFGSNIPTTTILESDGSPVNCNISPQDEPALLKEAFGCR